MSNESIPVGLRSLLAELHFIAQFERGKKPCMSDMTFVSSSSYIFGPITRKWKGENRKTLISDLEKVVEKFIDALTTYKDRKEYVSLLINLMANCRVSIESSLTTTYRDDPEMIGKIRVMLKNIDLQLKKYPHLIKGNSEKKNTTDDESNSNNNNSNNNNNNNNDDVKVRERISNSNNNNNNNNDDVKVRERISNIDIDILSSERSDRRRRKHRSRIATEGTESHE